MTWTEIPIRSLYRRIERRGMPDLPLLSVYRELGVVPRDGREDNFNRPGEDLAAYKVVEPGDLVLNKMKTWQGSIGVSAHRGIVSPAYFVAKPTSATDGRFMHHLLRSAPLIGAYAARSKGIRPSQWDLPWDEFAAIRMSVPMPTEQRAIADFLDIETARIDGLLASRARQLALLDERWQAAASELITNCGHTRSAGLGVVLDRLIDYRGATPEKTDTGVPLITASHIAAGRVQHHLLPQFVSEETRSSWMTRGLPRPGDLLLTTEAPLGEVALLVDAHVALAQRLVLLRPRPQLVSNEFLYAYLRSPDGHAEVQRRASGSTVMGIRSDRLRSVPVPLPDLDTQAEVAQRLRQIQTDCQHLIRSIDQQVDLLHERKQALITAAVTGQLDLAREIAEEAS